MRTPYRAPQANGVAARFVRTVRTECLDWLLLLNQQHLEHAVTAFVHHDNTHWAASRIESCATPSDAFGPRSVVGSLDGRVQRRDRLGGLVHEYVVAA